MSLLALFVYIATTSAQYPYMPYMYGPNVPQSKQASITEDSSSCGYVDVGDYALAMDTCYVQCSEITDECTSQRFYCDSDENLYFELFSDTECETSYLEQSAFSVTTEDRIKSYSCTGSDGTCTVMEFTDQLYDADTDTCGMTLTIAHIVAEVCLSDGSDGYFMQECDDVYTKITCDDSDCSENCVSSTVDLTEVNHDGCISISCTDTSTSKSVGTPLYFQGTPRNSVDLVFGRWSPFKFNVQTWLLISIFVVLAINAYYIRKNYIKNGKVDVSETLPLITRYV